MSLTATLSTAITGLNLAQRALAVTANNVANANTDGYSRKEIQPQEIVLSGDGRGVADAGTRRIVDEYLDAELRAQQGRLAQSSATSDMLGRVQDSVFGAPGDTSTGLAAPIQQLAAALEAFAASPEGTPTRIGVQMALTAFVDRLNSSADAVQSARQEADQRISSAVASVNTDLQSLKDVNDALSRDRSSPDLLDRRDALIGDLGKQLDVTVVEKGGGLVDVFTAGGTTLLQNDPRTVVYSPAAQVNGATQFGAISVYRSDQLDATGDPLSGEVGQVLVTSGVRSALTPELAADAVPDSDQVVTSQLTRGQIAGLIEARDGPLPELADQIAELGELARYTLNSAHDNASPQPPPTVVTGTQSDLSAWNGVANSGTAYLAVVNRASGQVVSTVPVDVTAADVPTLVSQINAGLGAFGTASINADGALEVATSDPANGIALGEGDSAIPVTDVAGRTRTSGFAHFFGLNDLIVKDNSGRLALRPDIAANAGLISSSMLDVTAGPPLASALGGAGDNRGAEALAAALDKPTTVAARGGLAAGAATIGDYAADVTAIAAQDAAQSQDEVETRQTLVDSLSYRAGAVSGVNVDEELGNLVTYQQAYSVSARIISITDELFQTLLDLKR